MGAKFTLIRRVDGVLMFNWNIMQGFNVLVKYDKGLPKTVHSIDVKIQYLPNTKKMKITIRVSKESTFLLSM